MADNHSQLYRQLYRIRRVEERVAEMYPTDCIKSPVHLSIGQEAVAVGACAPLRKSDVVFGTYRGHAAYLAKGGDLRAMIAELYGKGAGCAKGKGGSMHLIDVSQGIMGVSAVVGTTIANAIGYAYALALRGSDDVVVSFFGDGGSEEGVFHESLNFAALKKLPVIFICENNTYAIHTHISRRQHNTDICAKARAQGLPAERIEDNDVLAIRDRVSAAVHAIRNGQSGPYFFECMTYRWREHVGPGDDFNLGFRTADEAEPWRTNDQVTRIGSMLDASERNAIETAVDDEVNDAFAFAESAPPPDESELLSDIFASS